MIGGERVRQEYVVTLLSGAPQRMKTRMVCGDGVCFKLHGWRGNESHVGED